MKFNDITRQEASTIGRSLEQHMSLAEIMFLQYELGDMTDDQINEIVGKIPKHLMPEDFEQNQGRVLLRIASMNVL